MRRTLTVVAGVCLLLTAGTAFAHRIDEYLQATVLSLQTHRVDASMRLIPGVLVAPSVIAEIDSNGDGVFSQNEERIYAERVLTDLSISVDGESIRPRLLSFSFPPLAQMRDGLGEIHIDYFVDLPPGGRDRNFVLSNHHQSRTSVYLMNVLVPDDPQIHLISQKRDQQQTTYELDYEQTSTATSHSRWRRAGLVLQNIQFGTLFHLGIRHIAEGTDHLLFLLTLLLPAPLLVASGRWGPPASVRLSLLRILGIVTAFTIGHSITLTLAALHIVSLPSRPIEVLIAVSIFVSALHALRPIVPGKEAFIAVFFGFIHGLAFASTLDRLGLQRWERVGGILAFNLGIEAMQMVVVFSILPSLLLLSRTRSYPTVRIGGAIFALLASTGWIIERVSHIETPVDRIVSLIAAHALWLALALFVMSVAFTFLLPRKSSPIVDMEPRRSLDTKQSA